MSRPMGITKRQPAYLQRGAGVRYDKLSKADWADAFCDLLMQTEGNEEMTPEAMVAEAERRIEILKANGIR